MKNGTKNQYEGYVILFRREDAIDTHINTLKSEGGKALESDGGRTIWAQIERVFNYERKVRAFCNLTHEDEEKLNNFHETYRKIQKRIEDDAHRDAQRENPDSPILLRYNMIGIICEDQEAIEANNLLLQRSLEARLGKKC